MYNLEATILKLVNLVNEMDLLNMVKTVSGTSNCHFLHQFWQIPTFNEVIKGTN